MSCSSLPMHNVPIEPVSCYVNSLGDNLEQISLFDIKFQLSEQKT